MFRQVSVIESSLADGFHATASSSRLDFRDDWRRSGVLTQMRADRFAATPPLEVETPDELPPELRPQIARRRERVPPPIRFRGVRCRVGDSGNDVRIVRCRAKILD